MVLGVPGTSPQRYKEGTVLLVELIRTYLDDTGATLTEQARKTVTVGTEDLNVALNIIPTKLLTYFFDYEQYYKESHRICALGKICETIL